jgi:hypothetical protein
MTEPKPTSAHRKALVAQSLNRLRAANKKWIVENTPYRDRDTLITALRNGKVQLAFPDNGKTHQTDNQPMKGQHTMTYTKALAILVNGTEDSDLRYKAVQTVEREVYQASKVGDPDHSLQDWISAGQYKLTDTPESIAAEWDSDRD